MLSEFVMVLSHALTEYKFSLAKIRETVLHPLCLAPSRLRYWLEEAECEISTA